MATPSPQLKNPPPAAKPRPDALPKVVHLHTFRPTPADTFRLKRAKGTTLWCVEVVRSDGKAEVGRADMDPPDTLDNLTRKVGRLVREAETR